MALDDRDRNFEKALDRQLRSGDSAADCPDAEMLAAYHERMLSTGEMIAGKSHIAGCARCQEILASLEATDAIAIGAVKTFLVEEPAAAGSSEAEQSVMTVEMLARAAPSPARASAKVGEIPRRAWYWRWVAPAGAIAAGLLVWISTHEWRPLKRVQAPFVEVAQNREPSAPLPELVSPARPQPPAPQSYHANAASKDEAMAKAKSELADLDGQRAGEGKAKLPAVRRLDHGPGLPQNQNQNQLQNQIPNQAPNKGQELYSNQAPPAEQRVETQPQAAAPTTERAANAPAPALAGKDSSKAASADAFMTAPAAAGAVAEALANEKKAAEVDGSTESRGQISREFGLKAKALGRDRKVSRGAFIHTTDPQVFWLVGEAGRVYKTLDAGATVKQQRSGVSAEILAGSAPDSNVCWLAGRSGVILRTVDGGDHWTKLAPPAPLDFNFIQAADALHAILSDGTGQKRFSTNDGGATWTDLSQK
jgi:hypothetical protein